MEKVIYQIFILTFTINITISKVNPSWEDFKTGMDSLYDELITSCPDFPKIVSTCKNTVNFWNPFFEELFLQLIQDDVENGVDSQWRSLLEIQQKRSRDFDVYEIALTNQVDYEIEVEWDKGEVFTTVVYYALLKHIFLVEDEKYPDIPGSERTIQAYKELYDDHLMAELIWNNGEKI